VRFAWDPARDELNKKKHGISFEEAKEVFAYTYVAEPLFR